MARAPKTYTRLTRSPLQLGTYKSLWLAADHIMQVESSGYTESYQRLHLADIQGFFVKGSDRRLYWNIFWSLWALLSGIPLVGSLIDEEVPGASMVFFGVAAVFLLWNNLLGPSCRVYAVTKVQTLHIGSLARRRKTNKVLGRIQPLIEEAQRTLSTSMPITAAAGGAPGGSVVQRESTGAPPPPVP